MAALERMGQLQHELEERDGWRLEQRVELVLTRLSLPADVPVDTLSGGWRRRVLLARALVAAPDLESLAVAGSGDAISEGLKTRALKIALSGSGSVRIAKLEADNLTASVDVSGSLRAVGRVGELTARIAGSGGLGPRSPGTTPGRAQHARQLRRQRRRCKAGLRQKSPCGAPRGARTLARCAHASRTWPSRLAGATI